MTLRPSRKISHVSAPRCSASACHPARSPTVVAAVFECREGSSRPGEDSTDESASGCSLRKRRAEAAMKACPPLESAVCSKVAGKSPAVAAAQAEAAARTARAAAQVAASPTGSKERDPPCNLRASCSPDALSHENTCRNRQQAHEMPRNESSHSTSPSSTFPQCSSESPGDVVHSALAFMSCIETNCNPIILGKMLLQRQQLPKMV